MVIDLSCVISDTCYSTVNNASLQSIGMTEGYGGNYSAIVIKVGEDGEVEYYIEAIDNLDFVTITDKENITVSTPIGVGCRQWGTLKENQVIDLVESAGQLGITLFDTADIYGRGKAEELLGASETAYQGGTVDFLSLIDAQRMLLRYQLFHARAVADNGQKLAELEMLAGTQLPGKSDE